MRYIHEKYPKRFLNLPEKVLQFGEGNFLRAFVDWMVELSNRQGAFNGSVVICQPIENGMCEQLNAQDCQYTVVMRGIENGVPVQRADRVSSVSRCIDPYKNYQELLDVAGNKDLRVVVSNTTEAGIAYRQGDRLDDKPPRSYPAKLCAFLYERFKRFSGASDKGLLILPVELIDDNGPQLKRIVHHYAKEWGLARAFTEWLDTSCEFASTLVDRIVTGYPRNQIEELQAELGYADDLLDTCELFNLWVIEADRKWMKEFPVGSPQANVIWTDDVTPYKKRKVRILNGAHTATVLAAYLAGHNIVSDFMNDSVFKDYLNAFLLNEAVPTIDLPRGDLLAFASAVSERFENPYIAHRLLDIALNSCSKYNARCVPTLIDFLARFGRVPQNLAFSMAAFIRFYRGGRVNGGFIGKREDGAEYEVRDNPSVLDFFESAWQTNDAFKVASGVLSNREFWSGRDLTELDGFLDAVALNLSLIMENGIRSTMGKL